MSKLIAGITLATLIVIAVPLVGFVIDKLVQNLMNLCTRCFGMGTSVMIYNYFTFIGVMHHELSHAAAAILTGAKILSINLFKPTGNTLGNVVFVTRGNKIIQSIQLCFTAVAPVFTGICTLYFLKSNVWTLCDKLALKIIFIYAFISVLLHTSMSSQDIKTYIKGVPILWLLSFISINILFNHYWV